MLIVLWSAACVVAGKPAPLVSQPVPLADPVGEPATPAEPAVTAQPITPAEPVKPAEPPPPDPAKSKADLLAAETAAFTAAKPVFDKWCAKCHGESGKKGARKHFDMATYPFGGHHAMEITGEIRTVLGLTGKKPSMPPGKKGAVQGDELALIKAWADAFDASHAGGAHEGHGGGHKH